MITMDEALKQLTSYERTINKLIKEISEQGPKTGHWIDTTGIYAKCSICNEEIYQTGDFKFCPSCGAKMIDQQESEG